MEAIWRRHRAGFAAVGLLCLLAAPRAVRAQDYFDPAPLDRFDGQVWGGLTIGQTTTADIKRMYRTGKGAVRPEAMVLSQPSDTDVNVQVMMDSRGENSRLVGFRLAYRGAGPDLEQLASGWEEPPEPWYPHERFSDWHVKSFPRHGVAAIVLREGVRETVPLVLLTTPQRANGLVHGMSRTATQVGRFQDKYPERERAVTFGDVSVRITEDGLAVPNQSAIEQELKRRMRSQTGSRRFRYVPDSEGDLTIAATARKPKDKEGSVHVALTLHGWTPFGKVDSTAQATVQFEQSSNGTVNVDRDRIYSAFQQARNILVSDVESKLRKLILTPQQYRTRVWNDLWNEATR